MSKDLKKYIAEFIGTAILVLFGCGTAVISGGYLVATALAFSLAIAALVYKYLNAAFSYATLSKIFTSRFCRQNNTRATTRGPLIFSINEPQIKALNNRIASAIKVIKISDSPNVANFISPPLISS